MRLFLAKYLTSGREVCGKLMVWMGFVAQTRLRAGFSLPRTDLAYGDGTGYAKSCEAVEDHGADLDL